MIRDRRDEDLDRLVEVLGEVVDRAGLTVVREPRAWLQEVGAERSWVFDQAPVSVAPTRNVVGHVQIHRASDPGWLRHIAGWAGGAVDELLVIGRLFVRPIVHDYGIARYLLTESVKYVESRGYLPVLDPQDVEFVPPALHRKLGFREVPRDADMRGALVRTG